MNLIKKRMGIYGRCSDDDSATKVGGSTVNQEFMGIDKAERLSRTTGIQHVVVYTLIEQDGQSGGDTDRPEYQKLWRLIALKKLDVLFAKDASRLNRSTSDFCALMEHCKQNNVSIYLGDLDLDASTPMGAMMFQLLAMIAEMERNSGIQRTISGIRAGMMHQNKIHGGRVYLGFDRDPQNRSKWVPNFTELKMVDRILDLIPQYDGYVSVCRALLIEGIRNKYDGVIRKDGLRRMFRSKKYEGINEVRTVPPYSGKRPKSLKPEKIGERPMGCGPVVDLDKLGRARAKLDEWDKLGNRTRNKNRVNFLAGLLQCEDGSLFAGDGGGTSANGKYLPSYKNKLHGISLKAELIESKVIEAISCYKNDDEMFSYFSSAVAQINQSSDVVQEQITHLKSQLREIQTRERELSSSITKMTSERVTAFLEEQLSQIDRERNEAEQGIVRLDAEKAAIQTRLPNLKNMKDMLEFVFKNFDKAEDAVKRNFMRQLFEKIVVYKDNQIGLFWKFADESSGSEPIVPPVCDTGGHDQGLKNKWGDQRGLNPRHLESQSSALPSELWPPHTSKRLRTIR